MADVSTRKVFKLVSDQHKCSLLIGLIASLTHFSQQFDEVNVPIVQGEIPMYSTTTSPVRSNTCENSGWLVLRHQCD